MSLGCTFVVVARATLAQPGHSNIPSDTRRGNTELCVCWWCRGSRAWHPLAPSWVPLPTLIQEKHTGVHGQLLDEVVEAGGHGRLRRPERILHTSTWSWTLEIFNEPLVSCSHPRDMPFSSPWKSGHYSHKPFVFGQQSSSALPGSTVDTCTASVWVLLDVLPTFST